MALDFTIVINVRQQFGDDDQNIGVFAGRRKEFRFDCPNVSSDQAFLLFQSSGVSNEQVAEINGVAVFGGVPETDAIVVFTTGFPTGFDVPSHDHPMRAISGGWTGNVMLIQAGVLRSSGNVLVVRSSGDEFVIDNLVVVYKVRGGQILDAG